MADSRLQIRIWELEQREEVTQHCYRENLAECKRMAARLDRMKEALRTKGNGSPNLPA